MFSEFPRLSAMWLAEEYRLPGPLHPAIGAPPLFTGGANDCLIGRSSNGCSSAGAKARRDMSRAQVRSACCCWADFECRNLGRIWRDCLVGAQYCCDFTQPDVCPMPCKHSRALRSAIGRIRLPVKGGVSIRESTGGNSLPEACRKR
jgi:hypothetical protein